MSNLSIDLRLRPIRFGFVVRPEDKANLRRIFQINTCLWGGIFNPIIPFFTRVPMWWEREGHRFDNAKQIVNGYLDYFEPDFVAETAKGIVSKLGIDSKRVLQLSDLLPRADEREDRGFGQNVFDLYRDLYRKEFQFERRHKAKVIDVRAADTAFDNFAACLFGGFPKQANLKYFSQAFKDAFDPEEIELDGATLAGLYKSKTRALSALRMGRDGLDVDYNDHGSPTLFILDARESRDLLDFWNYRAVHQSGVAVPVQWLPELSEFCRDFVIRNYRPLPGNPNGVMIHPLSMFSRSIAENEIGELHKKYLWVDKEGANSLQTWYPPIWREAPEIMVRRTRPTIAAAAKKVDVPLDMEKPHIRFDSLTPDFADRFGAECRWANVIRLADWSSKDRIATVFPTDFRVKAVPRFGMGLDHLLSTTEGLVNFPRYRNSSNYWELIEGKEAIERWLKGQGITCQLSESGRATQQIIQTLSGFAGVRSLAHKGIIDLLDGMARRPITRSAHHQEFRNKVAAAIEGDFWRERVFESLVERKAVELGYELKCAKCGSWSWYALNQLNTVVSCDLCLQQFYFPITNPTDSKHARWAYRVVGPFALPEYAKGGYAAALAIRFFADVIGRIDRAEVTWSPGQELTLAGDTKVEADFLLWYQRRHTFGTDHPTQIVFGEAKSFGKTAFKDDDVERMKLFAGQYPGAALVFATLKQAEELSRDEIARIRKLAEWGREYDKERRQNRAPVVMLTGTELFAPHYLEDVWKEKGGKHKQFIDPAYVRLDNLRTLADLTQQLYLEMPSYSAWREEKWKARASRRRTPLNESATVDGPIRTDG